MSGRTLLKGGQVVTGSGGGLKRQDVLFDHSKIIAVAHEISTSDAEVIDVSGKVVTPGFIDVHVHAEGPLMEEGVIWGALSQGVTTMVLGSDGCGWAPTTHEAFAYMRRYFRSGNGDSSRLPDRGISVAELLALYDRRTACNVAYLVPNGTLRAEVMGVSDAVAGPDEIKAMRTLLEVALDDGAVGLSSGLDYIPSRFATHQELVEITAPLRTGGIYASHMAGYGDQVAWALDGLSRVGLDSGIRVHASHLWGPAKLLQDGLDAAQSNEVSISWDMYPFTAGCSLLSMVSIPPDWQLGSLDEVIIRLADPNLRPALNEIQMKTAPEDTILMSIGHDGDQRFKGLSVAVSATLAGKSVMDFVADLLVAARMEVGVLFYRPFLKDSDVEYAIERRGYMAGSDGGYVGGERHPRATSTFTRVLLDSLQRHGADAGWEEAVWKLSTNAAERFSLGDRGRIRENWIPDLLVFDPNEIRANSTYERPSEVSSGLVHAFVAGSAVVYDGLLQSARPGVAIRSR